MKKAAHKALALKWRPQSLDQLIGQGAIQTALSHALTAGRVHPACLFSGPRGTGKTSLARIVAKTIRCEMKKAALSPCLKCEECRLIQKGQSLDVLEIDGASANGVEAIRDLKSALSHMPSKGSKKIYIIDEVHMLSTGAFNALLKTLEEPPSHALFIMATTEAQKIPLTVISRCQKFDFRLIPPALVKERLEEITKSEGVAAEEKALWLIAREARGSLRDSQSLLDRMISALNGEKITFEKTAALLCQTPPALLFRALSALCKRDEREAAELLHDLRNSGAPPRIFLESLVEGLRDLIALKLNPENRPPLVSRSAEEMEEMKGFSSSLSAEDLHFLFSIALQGERDLNFCHDSLLALEILLLKLCAAPRLETLSPANPFMEKEEIGEKSAAIKELSLKKSPPLSEKSEKKELPELAAKTKASEAGPLGLSRKKAAARGEGERDSGKKAALDKKRPEQGLSAAGEEKNNGRDPALPAAGIEPDKAPPKAEGKSIKELEELWLGFLSALEKKNPVIAGIVGNLSLKGGEKKSFIFFEPDPFLRAKVEKNLEALIKALEEFLKESGFSLRFQKKNTEHEGALPLKTLKRERSERLLMQSARQDPATRMIQEIFNAKIVKAERVEKA